MTDRQLKLQRATTRDEIEKRTRKPFKNNRLSPYPYDGTQISIDGKSALESHETHEASGKNWAALLIILTGIIWGAALLVGFQTALAIQVGLGFLLAVIGIFSPSLGLFAIGMLSGLNALAVEYLLTGGLLRFNSLNYLLLIVMLFYLPFILRLKDVNSRALQLFIVLMTLELVLSRNISEGLDDILNISTTFGIVVFFARAAKDEINFYWLGLVNGVLGALVGLVFFLQFEQLPYTNPNNWTYLQLTALFSICIAINFAHSHQKNKFPLLLLAVVNYAWVFLSGSRGSLLIATICIVYLFLSTRSITWSSVMVGIAILVGLWVSTRFVEQQVNSINRIQLLFNANETENVRTSKRTALVQAGLEIFRNNPLGIGTGNFRVEAVETSFIRTRHPAHSAWVKVLVENGIPGVILLLAFVGSFALVGIGKDAQGKLLFGLFLSTVFATAFIAKEFQEKGLWFLAAGGIVLLRPKEMLDQLNRRLKPHDIDYRQRLREVRFGRRR